MDDAEKNDNYLNFLSLIKISEHKNVDDPLHPFLHTLLNIRQNKVILLLFNFNPQKNENNSVSK
jgi:hypothetical protein